MKIDWERLMAAVAFIAAGHADRVDGDGWRCYAVGANLIRIDLAKR